MDNLKTDEKDILMADDFVTRNEIVNFVTREELSAHLEALNERSINHAVKIGTALVTKAMEQHIKACPYGFKMQNYVARITGIVVGVSTCSAIIGVLLSTILKDIWSKL